MYLLFAVLKVKELINEFNICKNGMKQGFFFSLKTRMQKDDRQTSVAGNFCCM